MIPKIIHLTTKTGNLSRKEEDLLNANKKIIGDFEIKIYSDEDNLKFMTEYFPEFLGAYNKINKGVVKADVVRYLYLYQFGGIYCDTDYMFLKKIPTGILAQKCVIPSEWIRDDGEYSLGQCIMMSEPKVGIFYDFIKHKLANVPESFNNENDILNYCGPAGLTNFFYDNVDKYNYVGMTNPFDFNPRCNYLDKMGNRGYSVMKESIGIHLCFGSWRMETAEWYVPITNIKINVLNENYK